jgi:hypothetical protein
MSKFSKVVSSISSKFMMILVLVYLFLKTLVNPVFTDTDKMLASSCMVDGAKPNWIKIIDASGDGTIYLPEARADLLFELGLYFPKEK